MDISRALKKVTQRFPNKRVVSTIATRGRRSSPCVRIDVASAGSRIAVTRRSVEKTVGAASWTYLRQLWKFAPVVD